MNKRMYLVIAPESQKERFGGIVVNVVRAERGHQMVCYSLVDQKSVYALKNTDFNSDAVFVLVVTSAKSAIEAHAILRERDIEVEVCDFLTGE